MHNIKEIRNNPKVFDEHMQRRGLDNIADKILELDKNKRGGINNLQELQQKSNELAKQIGSLMGQGKRDEAQEVIKKSKIIKEQIANFKDSSESTIDPIYNLLSELPNLLDEDIPDGKDENDNIEIRKWGNIKEFSFTPKQHFDIGENLQADTFSSQLDFEQAVKISGSRFSILKGDLAKLERALSNFMLDIHTNEFGYEEVSPPLLVNSEAMYGTSQLPKFAEDAFKTTDDRWLISTGEIPITNMVSGMIIDEDALPYRFVAHTPCFRSEAGSAGKDTRGLIRMHQFYKVELVSITKPEDSKNEHERMTNCAEEILKKLELPYRVMLLCSGDTGFASQRTYDLEVWLPGQNTYREISSCSNCGDFQARRMNARYRPKNIKDTNFVHTLNGSALALSRTIVAIMENYQNEDGSVNIPEALVPYMGGKRVIV